TFGPDTSMVIGGTVTTVVVIVLTLILRSVKKVSLRELFSTCRIDDGRPPEQEPETATASEDQPTPKEDATVDLSDGWRPPHGEAGGEQTPEGKGQGAGRV